MGDIERGITVGLSWPRPTTACNLTPRWEGEFCSHGDWVSFASKRLTVAYDSNGSQLKAICVDTLGRRCANGRDFQRAHDEGTFPVRYFWDCAPAPSPAHDDLIAALEKARDQFLFYERSHIAKYSARDLELARGGIVDIPLGRDAYEKALVNRDMAEMCAAALVKASSPSNEESGA